MAYYPVTQAFAFGRVFPALRGVASSGFCSYFPLPRLLPMRARR
jgi:hypothetical protein